MKRPLFRRIPHALDLRHDQRGITMVLVAVAMVGIIAMAALSIDVSTLYLAREEAQRSADAGALAAAKVISLSGIMGDPSNSASYWQLICGGTSSPATLAANAVASQSGVGNLVPTITVAYSAGGTSSPDCSTLASGGVFAVNGLVTVTITRSSLPTFFSRIWGNTGNSVSATATAEVFNPSNSGNEGNTVTGTITPVQPRCVKPLMVPNLDPLNPAGCTGQPGNLCQPFVSLSDGHIVHAGISTSGGNANGVIGERFLLIPDCTHHVSGSCALRNPSPIANHSTSGSIPGTPPNNLEFLPGQASNSSVAVPSGAVGGSLYEQALAGCDQTTVYQCGVASSPSGNQIDLTGPNPDTDTTDGIMALIHEGNASPNGGQPTGQDYLNPYALPSAYPFQILAGSSSPLVTAGLTTGTPISTSNSIVTVPIYDPAAVITPGTTSPVTIVGFLQVFINGVDQYGNVDALILNVSGCSNGGGQPVGTAVAGSSPVPVRLITPP
jgi:Flp pilus assembly protein TadG